MLCIGAVALAMMGGSALAGALDNPDTMAPFFTDANMTTMKSADEMKAAWAAMPKDTQDMMMKECQDATMSKPHAEFCQNLMQLAGQK
jgi:hypothetical protein